MARLRRPSDVSLGPLSIPALARKISLEAGAAPLALYTSRSSQHNLANASASSALVSVSAVGPAIHTPSGCDAVYSSQQTAVATPTSEEPDKSLRFEVEPRHLVRALSKHAKRPSHSGSDGTLCDGKDGNKSMADLNPKEGVRDDGNHIVGGEEVVPEKLSKTRMILLGAAMMLTYFLGAATVTSVVLAIPNMSRDLGITELEAQWVSSAYGLAYGCGLLFAGRLADIYGRKFLFLTGVSIYLVFSVISAVIRIQIALCIIRAFAGLGLAIASPAGFGIVGVTFRDEPERTIAFAVFGLGNPVGAAVGMVLGGLVAGIGPKGWSYLFYILGGLAVIPVTIGLFVIPRDTRDLRGSGIDRRIDWLGAGLITAAVCLFTFSITQSGVVENGWSVPYIPVVLVISILLFVAFGFWEYHVENRTTLSPIAKLSLLSRNGYKVTMVMLSTFSVFTCVSGYVYSTSIYYQSYKGLTSLDTAIRLLPACCVGMLACVVVMVLAPRVKAPYLLIAAGFSSGLANLLFAVEPEGSIYWGYEFVAMLCLPFGADIIVGVGSIITSNLCQEDEQSVAGALFQTSVQLASAMGICISSLLTNQQTITTGSVLSGLRATFWMNCAWAWLVPIIVFLTLRDIGLAKNVSHGFH